MQQRLHAHEDAFEGAICMLLKRFQARALALRGVAHYIPGDIDVPGAFSYSP